MMEKYGDQQHFIIHKQIGEKRMEQFVCLIMTHLSMMIQPIGQK